MDNIIDGKEVSKILKEKLAKEISLDNLTPKLVVIQVGDNSASNIYIKNKRKACEEVGISFELIKFDDSILEDTVIEKIEKLNDDISINGILVQLPLPDTYNTGKIINTILPEKDVDGLTYTNAGNLVLGDGCLVSCTPKGVMELLKMYNVELEGKNVTIVGRSNLVGKPLIQLLLQKDATINICHSKSKDIIEYTKLADILIVATGHPKLITKDMVKKGVVVIDVGINREDDHLCGDVDFKEVQKKASLITPVPGGVGPMTVVSMLQNVVKAYRIQHKGNYEN